MELCVLPLEVLWSLVLLIKYDIDIEPKNIEVNLQRLLNQIYKLLPNREEGIDWQNLLSNIIEELSGMDRLFVSNEPIFFRLLCKLEGLFLLTEENDFPLYRKTIFECINLIGELIRKCRD